MPTLSPWHALESATDAIVDAQFAEPVEFHPWNGGQHAFGDGFADPTRQILITEAIYVVPGARATGEAGTMAMGLSTRVVTNDEWISISEDNLGDPVHWQMYDRIYLPERDPSQQWHSITVVMPSATARYNVYTVRLHP